MRSMRCAPLDVISARGGSCFPEASTPPLSLGHTTLAAHASWCYILPHAHSLQPPALWEFELVRSICWCGSDAKLRVVGIRGRDQEVPQLLCAVGGGP